jgi:hypothetical protein
MTTPACWLCADDTCPTPAMCSAHHAYLDRRYAETAHPVPAPAPLPPQD